MSFHSKVDATRQAKRARVLMRAALLTASGSQKVTVRDISHCGAHVLGVRGLRRESDVVFSRGELFAPARVAWVDGDEAGLRFYRELSPKEIEGALPISLLRDRR